MIAAGKNPDVSVKALQKFDLNRMVVAGNVVSRRNHEVLRAERRGKSIAKGIASASGNHNEIRGIAPGGRSNLPLAAVAIDLENSFAMQLCSRVTRTFEQQPVQCQWRKDRDVALQPEPD